MRFLGGFELHDDEGLLPELPTRKVKSLFAYLVMHRDRSHPREQLAELFWGELGADSARNNLRYALSVLRQTLGAYLAIDRQQVRFRAERYELDVEEFEGLITQARSLEGLERERRLRRAVELYRGGGFLPGFYDEWVIEEQGRLELLYLEALDALALLPAQTTLLRSPPLRLSEEAGLKRELARAHYARREPEAAQALAQQALRLYEQAHDLIGQAKTYLLLGVIHRYLGQSPQAAQSYRQALALSRRAQDRRTEWQVLNNLGWLAWNDYRAREALARYEQALPLCRAIEDRWGEAIVLNNWGIALLDLSEFAQALERFRQADRLIEELGEQDFRVENLSYRALAHWGLEEKQETLRCTREALRLIAAGAGSSLIYKAEFNAYLVFRAVGRPAEAHEHLRRAYEDTLDRLQRIQDTKLREGAVRGNRSFREICEAGQTLGPRP